MLNFHSKNVILHNSFQSRVSLLFFCIFHLSTLLMAIADNGLEKIYVEFSTICLFVMHLCMFSIQIFSLNLIEAFGHAEHHKNNSIKE